MSTEQDLKKTIKTNHPNLGDTKTRVLQIKKWLLTHRLNTRKKIILNSVNLSTVLTFLPFALGLFQFLTNKISSPITSESFFQKNLPLFANLNPKYNYETLNYILKLNKEILSNDKNLLLSQPKFIAKVKKPPSFSSKKFTGIACGFYMLESGLFLYENNSGISNFDELPSYLQGLKQSNGQQKSSDQLLIDLSKKQKNPFSVLTHDMRKVSDKIGQVSNPLLFSSSAGLKSKILLVNQTQLQVEKKKSVAFFDNPFFQNREDFYNSLNFLNLEFQNLFIQTKISSSLNEIANKTNPPISSNQKIITLEEFFNKNLKRDDNFLIESILRNLETQTLSPDSQNYRLMSGYNYPDMVSIDLQWLLTQKQILKFIFNNASFGNFQTNLLFPEISKNKYFFTLKNLPAVLIETKKIVLQSTENKVFYNGPALVLDSQRAFDWKTHGDKNLRSWFHDYISPLNPINQTQENFFGIYQSPKFSISEQNTDDFDFKNKALLKEFYFPTHQRWDLVRSPLTSNVTPFIASFHITSEKISQNERFLRGLDIQISNNDETISDPQFVPIIQLQQPNFRSGPQSKFNFNNYSPLFDLGITAKPDYKFSKQHLNQNLFVTEYASGLYTKKASIFSKSSRLIGSGTDLWEPLTLNSWLIISQLSFAVFIFQVLKSLADNYGRELLGYLLDLVASLGFLDDSLKQEIEILMGQREKGFRVVLKSRKNFTDIVGIEKFLPEIYEVVWFLRNSARDFALSKTLPRGILLTGPPGTGKTLLVQALAGEAQVPIVVLSGSSLIEPGESGSVKLEMVFQEARQVAPCIVFIDEIDTLAQKRSGVVHNPMGQDELVETLTSFENSLSTSTSDTNKLSGEKGDIEQQTESGIEQNSQQLGLLTQLLIELDGIQGRDGVIVIGATNRPEVLDSALLRPGRFDKILQVDLPKQQKRVEILQFYGQFLGYQQNIPWNYLAERTVGFTAADLATLMNESSIKAILSKSIHTIETIEHGIDRLTTSENEKYTLVKRESNQSSVQKKTSLTKDQPGLSSQLNKLTINSKLSILRLAYYQAGKIVLSYLLEMNPKSVVASLWPRRPTIRSVQITTNLQNSVFEFARLCELNDRLVGCYAGKAAEFLFLENFSSQRFSHISTLGLEDLLFAQKLIYSLLEKSFFYSKKSQIQKTITLFENLNAREFREIPEKLAFYDQFLETLQNPPIHKAVELETSSLNSSKNSEFDKLNAQMYYSLPWWQQETSNALEFVEKNFANWSRLYLSNPEQNERNPEWFPPDEFYHSGSGLKNLKKAFVNVSKRKNEQLLQPKEILTSNYPTQKINFAWNDVSKLTRDYSVQSLILQSFNKALVILNENRELLDRLVIELLYNEILRQPEIELILRDFQNPKLTDSLQTNTLEDLLKPFEKTQDIEILESSWGLSSRKPIPRWINFGEFSEETT